MTKESSITGILHDKNNEVLTFVLEDFKLTILPPAIYNRDNAKQFIVKADENGFIHGTTYTNHNIAFYIGTGSKLELYLPEIIWLAIYFISNGNSNSNSNMTDIQLFDGCSFRGDIIDYVVSKNRLGMKPFKFTENINIFCNNMTLDIGNNDVKIVSSKKLYSKIQFTFEEKLNFDKILKCYSVLSSICQFINFNKNDFISEFDILKSHEGQLSEHGYFSCATCYIKSNVNDDTLNTRFERILMLDNLSSKQIVKLFEMFGNENKKTPYINFLPENYENMRYVNIVKIKEICAALECECQNAKFDKNNKSKLMTEIKNDIKTLIKKYQEDYPDNQNEKVYSMILGNIRYWDLPLADKLDFLREKYNDRVFSHLCEARCILCDLNPDRISSFVKLRNKTSHGNFDIVTKDIVRTSFAMIAIIYCSILERIGLEDKEIINSVKIMLKRFI